MEFETQSSAPETSQSAPEASPAQDQGSQASTQPSSQPTPSPASTSPNGQDAKASQGGLDRLKQIAAGQKQPAATSADAKSSQAGDQAYKPNFKFKVANKEHEIDAFLHSVIQDPETEKKVKELYEKAYGLDIVKPRMQEYRQKAQQIETQFTGLQKELTQLAGKREKDLDGFMRDWQISDDALFQLVTDKLNYKNLPPEQRARIDHQRAEAQRTQGLEQQFQELNSRYEQQAVQARTVELQWSMERPEVKSFSDAFDRQYGNSGAFQNEVINYGKRVFLESGRDLSAVEAVKAVIEHYGKFVKPEATQAPAQGQPNALASQAAPQGQAPVVPAKKPVIPTIASRPSSPTANPIRSTDDLRKLARTMAESG